MGTAKAEKITVKTYTIKGSNLVDFHNFMVKNGPVVGGQKRAAGTQSYVNINYPRKVSGLMRAAMDQSGFDCSVTLKDPVVGFGGTISFPKATGGDIKKLSPKAKKEWERFLKALRRHEDGHIAIAKKTAEKVSNEMAIQIGLGQGKTEKDAQKNAEKDLIKRLNKTFTKAYLTTSLDAAQVAYDKKSHHGKDVKAVLDHSIK